MAHGYPDFEGGKSRLFTIGEWAAMEGTDKNFAAHADDRAYGLTTGEVYIVPAGKTLYITGLQFYGNAHEEADADNNQMCMGYIIDNTTFVVAIACGGNSGGEISLAKPRGFAAGTSLSIACMALANHTLDIGVSAQGYEI